MSMTMQQLTGELEQLAGERDQLTGEAEQLLTRSTGTLADDDAARFDQIESRLGEIGERESRLSMLVRAFGPDGQPRASHSESYGQRAPGVVGAAGRDDPWGDDRGDTHLRANRAVEALHRDGVIGEGGADLAARLVAGDTGRAELTRNWVLALSDPAYERAFYRMLRDPENGHRGFDSAELRAYQRAMALSPESAGGHMTVPFQLDPTIALASDGSLDPFRQVCRRVTISGTNSWKGVRSDGSQAAWYPEAATVADDSPELTDVEIPAHKAMSWIPFSFELDEDTASLRSQLTRLFADAKVQLEATSFTTGTGTGEPTGLLTALAAGQTVTTAAGAYAADDAYALIEGVPARFRAAMRVLASLPTINITRRLGTPDTEPPIVNDDYSRWLGKPLHETSTLDDTVTTGSVIAVAGDFQHMVLVDRLGMNVELVPHLFDPTTNRPTGQRGMLAHWRVGADLLVPTALRKLVVG